MTSPFEYNQWRLEQRKKRTARANRKRIKLANAWKHLNGEQLRVNGNSTAPPYKPSENKSKIATGMDGKQWTSNGDKWVRL